MSKIRYEINDIITESALLCDEEWKKQMKTNIMNNNDR